MKTETKHSGLGLGTILSLIFMTLKLTGHIDWSWWLVWLPMWGPLTVALLLILACVIVFGWTFVEQNVNSNRW